MGKQKQEDQKAVSDPVQTYINGGRVPWSPGYNEYRWKFISEAIGNNTLIAQIKSEKKFPEGFGIGLDDRAAEYPWIFSRVVQGNCRLLDAGSTFNFSQIVEHPEIANKDLSILTYHPEKSNFCSRRISYLYSDLREMPFKDAYFDMVVCQSTIEHIDKDNSIYGYDIEKVTEEKKSYEFLKAIHELVRVLKPGGVLLLTFPYGKFEDHGFFQQFDREMLGLVYDAMARSGKFWTDFILYRKEGWQFASAEDCDKAESFNPHTGRGKGDDGAAHCRCICGIEFIKNK